MASTSGAPQTPPDRILDELVAVYPYSVGGSMTSSRDGLTLYAAEGGAVAIIDADPNDPKVDGNFQHPIKRCPVGSLGVLPVQMRLDPLAGIKPLYGYCDLLYVAGGRDGLWAMQADAQHPDTPNLAVRLDDASTVGGDQDSRRWCDDVDFVTLGAPGDETTYLLALFGAKDDSQLRMYSLAEARAAADAGFTNQEELGHEIDPELITVFGRNSDPGTADYPASFAFGMDVDDVANFAYVAMGCHGLVRVKLKEEWPYPTPKWGPYFGDESGYAQTPAPVVLHPELYEDVRYYLDGEPVGEYPPFFLDVAVDRTDPNDRWVYAAVDHLGVVGFSLETNWDDFIIDYVGPSYVKYFHQEGVKDSYPSAGGSKQFVNLVVNENPENHKCLTFARRIQVVESSGALVVTTHQSPFLQTPGILNMSRTLSFDQVMLGGIPLAEPWAIGDDGHGYTIAYDLTAHASWASNDINAAGVAEIGRQMYAPPVQATGSLALFAGRHADGSDLLPGDPRGKPEDHELHRIEFTPWPPLVTPAEPSSQIIRRPESRAGRWVYRAGLNAANPEVLAMSSNEGGLYPNGPLVLDLTQPDGARIVANFDSGELDTDDPDVIDRRDGTNGVTFEPDAAVGVDVAPPGVGTWEYRFGMRLCRVDPNQPKEIRWRLAKLFGGTDVTNPATPNPPEEIKEIFFTAWLDQFNSIGYYQYSGAGFCPEYNQDRNVNLLFASALDTPQGIHVLDFQVLIDKIDDDTTGGTTDGQNYFLSTSYWNRARKGELTTHPEFWLVDDCREPGHDQAAENLLQRNGEFGGRVRTMPPQFIKLPSLGTGNPANTWVLAVPCAYAAATGSEAVFGAHSTWMPQAPMVNGHSHLMVRFFNIDDPSKIAEHVPSSSPPQFGSYLVPAYTLLGPDEGSAAWFLRTLHLDLGGPANDKFFCFVADLGGHLYVYEITNLLLLAPDFYQDGTPGGNPDGIKSHIHYGATIGPNAAYPNVLTPFATYTAPDCPADDLISNIWDVEVDQTNWTDDDLNDHQEVYVYVGIQREGVQVLRFDVDGTTDETRLVPVEMISTPGETSFLYLCDVPQTLEDADFEGTGAGSYVTDRLLFVGDGIAGFRIYTYGFEAQ